jgi:hypothetical protein
MMKKMNNILKSSSMLLVLLLALNFSACTDFFIVDTKDVLDHTEYIDEESEMYSGFIGIMTRVQNIGDKIIYITDTRGELLEPTINSSKELYSIYNYDADLTGNHYADPAGYYDVIIACNDYLLKLYEYKENNLSSINMNHYEGLISSTLRIKAWIYLTLGKIYGEAIWFDDPMRELKDISQFKLMDLDEIVSACKDLLTKGFDGVNGRQSIPWKEWLDPYTPTADSPYRYWDSMTPEYFALYAELCLWSGDYQTTANLILGEMNSKFASTVSDATQYLRNARMSGGYSGIWNNRNPLPQETVSAIIYDYSKNQTNNLLKHFSSEAPNEYLLAPSEVGINRFYDSEFNPLGSSNADSRAGITFGVNSSGNNVIRKFRPNTSIRPYAYQDDVHIYIYRAADLYFMLAEALNNLGRDVEASALINQGVNGSFPNGGVTWAGFTDDWTSASSIGNRKYPDLGIRGVFQLGNRQFEFGNTKANDLAILDEMMLEFPCEGRIYPAMVRIAKRYDDYNIIADRVVSKYSNPEEIRTKILNGGYFINWNLK